MDSIFTDLIDGVSWITALLGLAVCLIFYLYVKWAHMPPGPTGLPYLGYFPFLRSDFHVQLREMVRKYGDVFCFRCTGQLYVHLGSERTVREAHVTKSDCFAGRSTNVTLFQDAFGSGVGFENGEKWKDLRKFFILRLKEFGVGKGTQEGVMGDFQQKAVNALRKAEGENFDGLAFFGETCSRAIYTLLLSGTKARDEDIKEFSEAYWAMSEVMLGVNTLLAGPLLKYVLMYFKPEIKKYRKNKFRVESMLSKIIKEHERDFEKNNMRDIIDCYIKERKEMEEKGDPKSKTFSEKALVSSLMQMLGDGGFSVGLVVSLVLQQLSFRPEVQKQIQGEIDDIVGPTRLPSWDDRSRMPYTNAAISECFRLSDVFSVMPSLECTKETTVGDCRIPKGAVTLVNFWAVFRDPEVYEQPEKFDPTRFFHNDENRPKIQLPILFGVGKRSCIGESLVNMETFLFVTTILQNFDLHPTKEVDESTDGKKESSEINIMFRATPRTS